MHSSAVNRTCLSARLLVGVALAGYVLAPPARSTDAIPLDPALPRYAPAPGLTGALHSVGSDAMDTITFGWIQRFRAAHPNVKVTLEARSSLTAAPALTSGLADVAPVAREFLPSELATFKRKFGHPPTLIRVAGGSYATRGRTHALGIFVHRDNPLAQLTLAQLDAVYSATRRRGGLEAITGWGQLGLTGEWAGRPITVYGLRRPNGIVNFFQSQVMVSGEFRDGIHERITEGYAEAFDAVVASLAHEPNGIAYASFANHSAGIKSVKLSADAGGPFVAGTFENVLNRSYPLSRTVNIYVNKAPGVPLAPNVHEFLRLVLSREGQAIVAAEGVYLPLPAADVREELAKLDQAPGSAALR